MKRNRTRSWQLRSTDPCMEADPLWHQMPPRVSINSPHSYVGSRTQHDASWGQNVFNHKWFYGNKGLFCWEQEWAKSGLLCLREESWVHGNIFFQYLCMWERKFSFCSWKRNYVKKQTNKTSWARNKQKLAEQETVVTGEFGKRGKAAGTQPVAKDDWKTWAPLGASGSPLRERV